MKVFALQSSSDSAAAKRPNLYRHVPAAPQFHASPVPGSYQGVIQRKSVCSCGGDCPRCENKLPFQAKRTISEPGDSYEQKADEVADQVMRMPASSDSGAPRVTGGGVPNVARHSPGSSPSDSVPYAIHDVLSSPGQQLDISTRAFMESRFGHDFASVRVHNDRQATTSAIGVSARAYTVGDHIVFAAGEYRPETNDGRRLLAHELTHTLQTGTSVVRRSAISDNIQTVWDATPTVEALLARLSQADVQRAQSDADIDSKIATLLAGRAGDLWLAQRIRQGQLGTTAGARPVEAHFIQGTTNRRALVIAGVHGSEVQGIEVARRLLADLATTQPLFTVIVVPSLFPDNAVTRTREGGTPTNRNFPPPSQDLAAATSAGGGTARDARSRRIRPENIMLLQLIERFSPERIISIHGTVHSGAAGVFYDPVSLTPAEIAGVRSEARAMAAFMLGTDQQLTFEGQERLRQLEERLFLSAVATLTAQRAGVDSTLALAAAAQIEADTTSITGRERRPMDRERETRVDRDERARRRAHPSVPGNVGASGNIDTGHWSGATPGGVSLGDYASGRGISIFTVEPPLNRRTGDYPASIDSQVDAAERRIELEAYADAVRTVLLGR